MAIAEAPISSLPLSAVEARAALAAEWEARAPRTPDEVRAFYRTSEHLEADLDAFHTDPLRAKWTEVLLYTVKGCQAKSVCDIGSGNGHDLRALRAAYPGIELYGVEPNDYLREHVSDPTGQLGLYFYTDIESADIEHYDLMSCFDVLEHVPDPDAFLGQIATRAKLGAVLVETCATHDCGTPLHLKANRGWRTGRVLELHGWDKVGEQGRVRVWQRMALQNRLSTSIIPVVFRSVSLPTHRAIMAVLTSDPEKRLGWRELPAGEAGLLRARNVAVSHWYTATADDVFLMVDDDIVFTPEDAERLVTKCREGYDVIAAAYPVRDGGHLAVRALPGADRATVAFGPGTEPVEMRHVGTGFFAVHRRVLDALIPTLPLCHAATEFAYWPVFAFRIVEDEAAGGWNNLTEDYNLCEMVRDLGFKVWVDPSIMLQHLGLVPITLKNMTAIHEAIA